MEDNFNKINNNSVFKLIKLQKIAITFVFVLGLMTFISLLIMGLSSSSSSDKAILIIASIYSILLFSLVAYIVYLIFGVQIDKRKENIKYMNERLNYYYRKENKNKK